MALEELEGVFRAAGWLRGAALRLSEAVAADGVLGAVASLEAGGRRLRGLAPSRGRAPDG